jgi:hypothetical protein
LKISFDTTADSIEQVLEVIKAVYGVEVALEGAPEAAQLPELESVVVESDSGQEQASVREPEVAAPAEEPVTAVEESAAEAPTPAKRARSRSAVKAPAKKATTKKTAAKKETAKAESGEEAETAPAKKTATKKPAAKKTASRKSSALRSRKALEPSEAVNRRGSGTRASAAKSQSADGAKPEAKVVRAWAREQGLENISGRGTLPAWAYEQYAAAHA